MGDNSGIKMEMAAFRGEVDKVKAIFKKNPQAVEYRGEWQWTPLMHAADKGHNRVVECLVNTCKAPVDDRNELGHTALALAATKGYGKIVDFLLGNDADVDAADAMDRTPLMLASANGKIHVVKSLLKCIAEITRISKDKKTAVNMAEERGHEEIVKLIEEFEKGNNDEEASFQKYDKDVQNLSTQVSSITLHSGENESGYQTPDSATNPAYSRRISDRITDKMLNNVAKRVANCYQNLGIELGFSMAKLDANRCNGGLDIKAATFTMLYDWRNKLSTSQSFEERVEILRKALEEIDRNDVISEVIEKWK